MKHVRLVAICAVFGFLTQAMLAVAITPFLAPHTNFLPTGSVHDAKTNDIWLVGSSSRLGVISWEPRNRFEIAFGIMFPPTTEAISNSGLTFGVRQDLIWLGAGNAENQPRGGITLDPPSWSVMSSRLDRERIKRTREVRVVEMVVGWPMPSMYGRAWYHQGKVADPAHGYPWEAPRYVWAAPISPFGYNPALGLPIPQYDDPFLPLRPVFLGTVANTGFFALCYAGCWIMMKNVRMLFAKTRSIFRIRRGLCPACGYKLEGLAKCPECGQGSGSEAPDPEKGESAQV